MQYPATRWNPLALLSLIVGGTGYVSFLCWPLCLLPFGLIAVGCGVVALREIRGDPDQFGREFAWIGIVFGSGQLVVALLILFMLWIVVLFTANSIATAPR
ncbi:MAG: DUF4190 domain-containing protein [Dehalococcoidia bacterium]